MRSFKAKHYQEINQAAKEKCNPTKSIPKYSQPTGRPLMLGELDSMLQTYLRAMSKRGGVVNTSVANATAKALIRKYPNIVNPGVDIKSSRWAKCLFARMNFVKRRKTSSKVDILEGSSKEIEYLFLHDIVSKVEEYNIPTSLIVYIDQTPTKYVPVGSESLAEKGVKNVTIEGSADKRTITGTFGISKSGVFLPMARPHKVSQNSNFQWSFLLVRILNTFLTPKNHLSI